jgi:hypothetical protein
MSTLASLANMTFEQLAALPPEQRKAMGLIRPLTDAEFKSLTPEQLEQYGFTQPQHGAPIDFGGRVLKAPPGTQPHWDTDNLTPPTRLPNGVQFYHQNGGKPQMDVSNPSPAEVIPPQLQTVGAQFGGQPTETFSDVTPISKTETFSDVTPVGANPPGVPRPTVNMHQSALIGDPNYNMDTRPTPDDMILGTARDIYATSAPNIAHQMYRKFAGQPDTLGEIPEKATMLYGPAVLGEIGGVEPPMTPRPAAQPGAPDSVASRVADVAGDKLMAAARRFVAGRIPGAHFLMDLHDLVKAVTEQPETPTVPVARPPVAQPPLSVPEMPAKAPTGRTMADVEAQRQASRAAYMARTKAEGVRETPSGVQIEPETTPAPTPEAAPAVEPKVDTSPKAVEQQLNNALGGKPLQPNVPLKSQGKLPEGFSPVESSALKGYKYDPAAKEFEAITTGGQRYVYGDVSPDDVAKFEAADSKGRAFGDIRNSGSPLVAKYVGGKRVAVRPVKAASDLAPDEGDLTGILQQSLEQAQGNAPRFVYRARDVGEQGVPLTQNHAQATSDVNQALEYAQPGQRGNDWGQVVRIDLSKLSPSDYVIKRHPDGMQWVQFKRPLGENEVEVYAGKGAGAKK